jgi:hypothetical protein
MLEVKVDPAQLADVLYEQFDALYKNRIPVRKEYDKISEWIVDYMQVTEEFSEKEGINIVKQMTGSEVRIHDTGFTNIEKGNIIVSMRNVFAIKVGEENGLSKEFLFNFDINLYDAEKLNVN